MRDKLVGILFLPVLAVLVYGWAALVKQAVAPGWSQTIAFAIGAAALAGLDMHLYVRYLKRRAR